MVLETPLCEIAASVPSRVTAKSIACRMSPPGHGDEIVYLRLRAGRTLPQHRHGHCQQEELVRFHTFSYGLGLNSVACAFIVAKGLNATFRNFFQKTLRERFCPLPRLTCR